MIVGWMKNPLFPETSGVPAANLYPLALLSAKKPFTFSYCIWFWMGPSMAPSSGPPVSIVLVNLTMASRNSL
jgi:hypothetical protein